MTAVSRITHHLRQFRAAADRNGESLWLLLVLSGILGAVEGLHTATWQHPVETAQVLLGMVSYDPSSLPYAYHVSLFSLLNYVASLFLAVTHSEAASSALLAALLGILAMQTIAIVIFLVVRNVYHAVVIAAALAAIKLFGAGISYPIFFMGTEHAYGRAGLLFDIYALAWLAFSRFRTGLFLCGLAVGVHPAWGLWLNLVLLLAALLRYRETRALLVPANILAYAAGIALPLALFAWQKSHYPVTFAHVAADASSARDIFLNYVRYWDYHRQKFDNLGVLATGFFYALASLALSALHFRRGREAGDAGKTLFFLAVIVSTLLSIPLVFIPSWFDAAQFPEWFVALMPGRFINISIFLCTPLLFAALFGPGRDKILSSPPAQLAGILALFIVAKAQYGLRYAAALVLVSEGLLILRHALRRRLPDARSLGVPVIVLTFLSLLYPLHRHHAIEAAFGHGVIPLPVAGSILTTREDYMIQAQMRVSSLTPHIDGYVYLADPAAKLALDRFTTDLFGVPIGAPPPGATLHQSVIATADFSKLWESRDCHEWEHLAAKYHFGLIVVPAALHLKLERIGGDTQWNAYRPACAANGGAPSPGR
jgi:hypothetical protein